MALEASLKERSRERCFRLFFVFWLLFAAGGCAEKPGAQLEEQNYQVDDLEKVLLELKGKNARQEQLRKETLEVIRLLEDNLEQANSEGMKQKILEDISLQRILLQKTEERISNQDSIIQALQMKLDSLSS